MPSQRESVLARLTALLAAALPGAEVKRNLVKPERIPPGGLVVVRDGEPGEPEVTLSPLSYLYTHRILVEIAVTGTASLSREAALDRLLSRIGVALAADRTLAGACDWVEAEAPASEDLDAPGAQPARAATLTILAVYATADPLA